MAEDLTGLIEIINGDHDPPHPYMVVANQGLHVDFAGVRGELWDPNTTIRIVWGLRDPSNQRFGVVVLKDGTNRKFWDEELLWPYVKAYEKRKGELTQAMVDDAAARAEEAMIDEKAPPVGA